MLQGRASCQVAAPPPFREAPTPAPGSRRIHDPREVHPLPAVSSRFARKPADLRDVLGRATRGLPAQ